MEYYTAEEVYNKMNQHSGLKSNGLKFEDFILKRNIFIDGFEYQKKLLSSKPFKRNSENHKISNYGIYNGWRSYSLADATITDFSNEYDEIELKYYYGNNGTREKGVSIDNNNIFIPMDKLSCNRHFVFVFAIKNKNVMLYNIYCNALMDNGQPIGYINPTFYKEIKFIIATNEGFLYYNYTDDLTENLKKDNPDLKLKPTNIYPTIWNEELFVVDNRSIGYPLDILALNGKIKPIVYIPSNKFKKCYIENEDNHHTAYKDLVVRMEPLDFDKDDDYYIDYDKYCIRKGIKINTVNNDIDV
jgi:hypothetical protein